MEAARRPSRSKRSRSRGSCEPLLEHLQRDAAAAVDLVRLVDGAHAAAAERANDPIGPEDGAIREGECLRDGGLAAAVFCVRDLRAFRAVFKETGGVQCRASIEQCLHIGRESGLARAQGCEPGRPFLADEIQRPLELRVRRTPT